MGKLYNKKRERFKYAFTRGCWHKENEGQEIKREAYFGA
jgi:hypothetical protein